MDNNIGELETYFNRNGFPIMRRCKNCIFWKAEEQVEELALLSMGNCTIESLYFAFTLVPNVYPFTKEFYLCENHKLANESKLAEVSDKIKLKDAIKKKSDIR